MQRLSHRPQQSTGRILLLACPPVKPHLLIEPFQREHTFLFLHRRSPFLIPDHDPLF
jgi:hypothetical protein